MSEASSPTATLTPKAPPPRTTGGFGVNSTSTDGGKYNPRPPARKPASNLTPSATGEEKEKGADGAASRIMTSSSAAAKTPVAAAARNGGDGDTPTSSRTSTLERGLNANPLHDVGLYQALVQQLPDCPVIDSILFTHRGVLEDAETPNEQLATLDDRLEQWKGEQRAVLDEAYARHQAEEAQRNQDAFALQLISNEKRDAKLSDLSMRIEALETAVQKDVSRVLSAKTKQTAAADGGPPEDSPFRKEWELLQIKKKERDAEVKKECERLEKASNDKSEARRTIAFTSDLAKIGINEQLSRCAVFSEQEHDRVAIKRVMVNARERLSALDDAREFLTAVVAKREEIQWEALVTAFDRKL